MKRLFIQTVMLFVAFWPICSYSQVTDSFADSNLISNPTWLGDTAHFNVNASLQLQLNNYKSDTSVLYTSHNKTLGNEEWSFFTKLDFAPSNNNQLKVYLCSDQANIDSSLNGYYVKVGENGSGDNVDLYRQTGYSENLIVSGSMPAGKSSNSLRIKVLRDSVGNWDLFVDTLGGYDYIHEGTAFDTTIKSSMYFGLHCKYTSSNAKSFSFDDIYAGTKIIDPTPPKLDSIAVINRYILDLFFNEPLSLSKTKDTSKYFINNSLGRPYFISYDSISYHKVRLYYSTNFIDSLIHILQITGIEDLAGNAANITDSFYFYLPKQFDLLINEIMPDPDPPVGLPNKEYIELYNRSAYAINIENWTLQINASAKSLPSFLLEPHEYLIITDKSDVASFMPYGQVLGINGLPSLANTGSTIKLMNADGDNIYSISYDESWYHNDSKADGGYSLELIDPYNPCGEYNNWHHSKATSGGTPGTENSVNGSNPDEDPAKLIGISVLDSNFIRLIFDELLILNSVLDTSIYTILPGNINPINVILDENQKDISLVFKDGLVSKIKYTLTIKNKLTDCVGNSYIQFDSLEFSLPETPNTKDLVINEIMFDPHETSVEFVEIYNRSEKYIEVGCLKIVEYDTLLGQVQGGQILFKRGNQIAPGAYRVLSKNDLLIRSNYTANPDPQSFINSNEVVTLSNEGKVIALADSSGNVIDWVSYSPDMHHPLLENSKGVSLERISPNLSSQQTDNWHSAASNVGYATPGLENSQSKNINNSSQISIEPEAFSPDLDGYNDFTSITLKLDDNDYTGSIGIFNEAGQLVRQLISKALLSPFESHVWDGTDDNGQKAAIGIYIVYFEATNPKGKVISHKKTCVLSSK